MRWGWKRYNTYMTRMTVTIDISDDMETIISGKGGDVQKFATFAIEDALRRLLQDADDHEESKKWWSSLSDADKDKERGIIEQSLTDSDAGRVKPAEEVFSRLRVHHTHSA
jgi:AAA+ ATPase superfamily predicted ATPase